jgi:hypothetical protein
MKDQVDRLAAKSIGVSLRGFAIAFVPLPGLDLGLCFFAVILRQRATLIVHFPKFAFIAPPHVAFVGAGINEFSFGSLFFGHRRLALE